MSGRAYVEAGIAALLFGVAAPLTKVFVGTIPQTLLGGLLYLGAGGLLSLVLLVRNSPEASLDRGDAPALSGVILVGGVAAPLLLIYGLGHSSAMAASLLLNLETVFTAGLALLWFHEGIDRRGLLALGLILAGALIVGFDPGRGVTNALGVVAVTVACLGWAVDNNLSRKLSAKDPLSIVRAKGLGAGSLMLVAGLLLGQPLPSWRAAASALAVGALGHGMSLTLYVHAQRTLGAARTGAVFAVAPFVGVLVSSAFLGERAGLLIPIAGTLMAIGIGLLVSERHGHFHQHDALNHEHVHTHDDHHSHPHEGGEGPEPHAHPHRHDPVSHSHPHTPDLHHRHRH